MNESIREVLKEHCLTEDKKIVAYHGGPKPIRRFDPKRVKVVKTEKIK